MKDLTVIIPIQKYDDEAQTLLKRAVASYKKADDGKSKLLFVGPKDVLEKIKQDYKGKSIIYLENENTEFQVQINVAVEKCGEYFSILEYDDAYTPKWFENVGKYMESNSEASIFLPLTQIILYEKMDNGPIGYVNDAVWATSFSNELGYLDLECLSSYMNFNTTGGVFKTDDFKKVGKLKESMKLTFWYEFLMRSVFNGKRIFVIPKVGYLHTLNRNGSLSHIYTETISNEEADFWIDLANKEYMFKNDRKKTFEQ